VAAIRTPSPLNVVMSVVNYACAVFGAIALRA
jgi:hypothetical protein